LAATTDGGLVDITFTLPPAKVYDRHGKVIDSVGGSPLRGAQLALDNESGRWHIVSIRYKST
jgi:hypothetical protein